MVLPNMILGGAQKSGTTTLHHLLAGHPEIFFPADLQEIHFFDLDENFRRGLDWYACHFEGWRGEPVIGQKSPLYLYDERVPRRIADALGDRVRLLFVLRHPADRAYSHYWHEIRHGFESLPFEAALAAEPERLRKGYWWRRHYSYLDRGRYATQLERFRACVAPERILVVLYEELRRDPEGVARRCAEFLGVAPDGGRAHPPGASHRNPALLPRSAALQRLTGRLRRPGLDWIARGIDRVNLVSRRYPPLAADTRRRIIDLLADEIERLGPLAGADVSHWLERGAAREAAAS
jgi:hypothetical protein